MVQPTLILGLMLNNILLIIKDSICTFSGIELSEMVRASVLRYCNESCLDRCFYYHTEVRLGSITILIRPVVERYYPSSERSQKN